VTILIDTSAWIEFFRRQGSVEFKSRVADLIAARCAAYTCPVHFELVMGARKDEMPVLSQGLGFATRIAATENHWNKASQCAVTLRAMGMNIPALDLLIASVALSENLPLLAKDAHFEIIREHSMPALNILSPQ